MLKSINTSKLLKFPGYILRYIVSHKLVWNAISCEDALEVISDGMGCYASELSDDGKFAILILIATDMNYPYTQTDRS